MAKVPCMRAKRCMKKSLPEWGSVADTTAEGTGFPATVDSVIGMVELVRIPFTWTGTVDPGS